MDAAKHLDYRRKLHDILKYLFNFYQTTSKLLRSLEQAASRTSME